MPWTELDRARELAARAYDEHILPLSVARRAAGEQSYFPLGPDGDAKSYFEPLRTGERQGAVFVFPGEATAEGLIDALSAHWTAQGEAALAALAPRLREMAAVLKDADVEGDGRISILCYTMF